MTTRCRRDTRLLDGDEIDRGLKLLDDEFGKSELIRSIAPLRLIATGAYLAVKLFKNRASAPHIDVLVDPNTTADATYRAEIWSCIRRVAREHGYEPDWVNEDLSVFLRASRRYPFFLESVQQDVRVFAGRNLEIYAVRLDFALEWKFRRVAQESGPRRVEADILDALAIIDYMVEARDGQPLSMEYCLGLDENQFGMGLEQLPVEMVARRYLAEYGRPGIV